MDSLLFFGISVVFLVGLPVNHAMPSPPVISQWPEECEGKTYCTTKPSNYPEKIFEALLNGGKLSPIGGMQNRSGEETEDVASCRPKRWMDLLYLIKDDNDRIRLVAQTETFQVKVQIEECSKPGRILTSQDLDPELLEQDRVDCVETKLPLEFLVLSIDGTTLESVAPKGGIPSSCSAKLMKG